MCRSRRRILTMYYRRLPYMMYLTGAALFCSGIAILLNIKRRIAATLLGIMIFIWVVILHIPYALSAPLARNEGEVTSAFLALAYCGIAFVIAQVNSTWGAG